MKQVWLGMDKIKADYRWRVSDISKNFATSWNSDTEIFSVNYSLSYHIKWDRKWRFFNEQLHAKATQMWDSFKIHQEEKKHSLKLR